MHNYKELRKISLIGLLFFQLFSLAQVMPLDPGFLIGNGANLVVNRAELQSNGKIIVAGEFTNFNSTGVQRIVRLHPNGTHDLSYATYLSGGGVDGPVRSSAIQPDGKVLIGGLFNNVNGMARKNIVRLDTNGVVDPTFVMGTGANNEITDISTNGSRIILAGFLSQYNGSQAPGFVCLLQNGTKDPSFLHPTSNVWVNVSHVLPNGKVYLGGGFTSYNGTPVNRLVRLNADGTIDTSFNIGTGFNAVVQSIHIQPDGKIIVGGGFSSVNGVSRTRIVRLNTNGSVDLSFNPGIGANSTIRVITQDAGGRIIIGGDFATYNGITVNRIARLLPNGTYDTSFNQGTGLNGTVYAARCQPDGKIIFGGQMSVYNGGSVARIMRLIADTCTSSSTPAISVQGSVVTCPGDTVILSIASGTLGANASWKWYAGSCGGTSVGTGSSITVSPNVTTTYFVRGEGNCDGPCAQITITATDTTAPVPNVALLPDLDGYCNVTILDIPTATDACAGPVSGSTTDSLHYSDPGTYQVYWIFSDHSGNTSSQVQLVIVREVDVDVVIDTVVSFQQYELVSQHNSGTATYQWVDCLNGYSGIPGATSSTFVPGASGTYALIIDEGICRDTTDCIEVTYFFAGVNEPDKISLVQIYPNPASTVLNISAGQIFSGAMVRIFAIDGRIIFNAQLHETGSLVLDITPYKSGVYFLEVEQNGEISRTRFQKI